MADPLLSEHWDEFLDDFEDANDDCVNNTVMIPKVKCVEGVWTWIMELDTGGTALLRGVPKKTIKPTSWTKAGGWTNGKPCECGTVKAAKPKRE